MAKKKPEPKKRGRSSKKADPVTTVATDDEMNSVAGGEDKTEQKQGWRFPIGNQFWKARSSHGCKPIFESPEVLWNACCEYFKWVDENPLYEARVFHTNGLLTHTQVPKMRAMTLAGLCIYLDIASSTWTNYRNNSDFLWVTTRVDEIIRTQKFEGAAAEFLNANIIARDLGLAEKTESKVTIEDKLAELAKKRRNDE